MKKEKKQHLVLTDRPSSSTEKLENTVLSKEMGDPDGGKDQFRREYRGKGGVG